jgi:hypothetical protein
VLGGGILRKLKLILFENYWMIYGSLFSVVGFRCEKERERERQRERELVALVDRQSGSKRRWGNRRCRISSSELLCENENTCVSL